MRTLHGNWFYLAVITNGVVGLWGLVFALTKRPANRLFRIAMFAAIGTMLVQVALGFLTYNEGFRPANDFHMFYGFVILFTSRLPISIARRWRNAPPLPGDSALVRDGPGAPRLGQCELTTPIRLPKPGGTGAAPRQAAVDHGCADRGLDRMAYRALPRSRAPKSCSPDSAAASR